MTRNRNFIEELKRKPQAFKGLAFRDALFPREAYRHAWEQLDLRLSQRHACQTIAALLEMAAREGVEGVLAERLDVLLAAGELPDIKRLRDEFAPRTTEVPHYRPEPGRGGTGGARLRQLACQSVRRRASVCEGNSPMTSRYNWANRPK